MKKTNPKSDFFWEVAQPYLDNNELIKGTIFGFGCVRTPDGEFVAAPLNGEGDLNIKLPKAQVDELIGHGIGQPFSPNGRIFKEWVNIGKRDAALWKLLVEDSIAFVS